ncbi:hypothetical protein HYX58_06385 [Candidatus Dependentiae bacterium]|nr:hypothetical protein [Candidatus Dependentiae bacterium]
MNTLRYIALGAVFFNLANVQAFPFKKAAMISVPATAAVAASAYAANRFGYMPSMPSISMPSVSVPSMETVKGAASAVKAFGGSMITKAGSFVPAFVTNNPKATAAVASVAVVGTIAARYFVRNSIANKLNDASKEVVDSAKQANSVVTPVVTKQSNAVEIVALPVFRSFDEAVQAAKKAKGDSVALNAIKTTLTNTQPRWLKRLVDAKLI